MLEGIVFSKAMVYIIAFCVISYVSYKFISENDKSSSQDISNKIICKENQKIVDGACVDIGPCGVKPSVFNGCSTDSLICDTEIDNKWRCPLPCENTTNKPPLTLGSCGRTSLKCDSQGQYYCENDTSHCSGHGNYMNGGQCVCNDGYYSGDCSVICPSGTYYQNGTCLSVLNCVNGTFSKDQDKCICLQDYSGNLCQFDNKALCNGHGIPNITTNQNGYQQFAGSCVCENENYASPFCCALSDKPDNTNTCIYKDVYCTQSGWNFQQKTPSEIVNTTGWEDGTGVCAKKYCLNNITDTYNVRLSYENGQVTCSTLCPKDYSCSGCGKTLPNPLTSDSSVCVCDEGTGYNATCIRVQTDNNCGITNKSSLPQLCADGSLPTAVHCLNGCLFHCGGYDPDSSDPAYAASLKNCISDVKNIKYNDKGYYAQYLTSIGQNPLPVYPTIDNERCVSTTTEATYTVNDFENQATQYWNLYNNPTWNVMSDGTVLDRNNYSNQEYNLYNTYRDQNGNLQLLQNLGPMKSVNDKNGCFSPISNYCNGRATYIQTCYKDDRSTKVDCSSSDVKYRLNEGKCSNCNTYVSTVDNKTKTYLGDRCQYDDINGPLTSYPNDGDIIALEFIINGVPANIFLYSPDMTNLTGSSTTLSTFKVQKTNQGFLFNLIGSNKYLTSLDFSTNFIVSQNADILTLIKNQYFELQRQQSDYPYPLNLGIIYNNIPIGDFRFWKLNP